MDNLSVCESMPAVAALALESEVREPQLQLRPKTLQHAVLLPVADTRICRWYSAPGDVEFGVYSDGRLVIVEADGTRIQIKSNNSIVIESRAGRVKQFAPSLVSDLPHDKLQIVVYPSKASISVVRSQHVGRFSCAISVTTSSGSFLLEADYGGALNFTQVA